jgi:hypothetical protein
VTIRPPGGPADAGKTAGWDDDRGPGDRHTRLVETPAISLFDLPEPTDEWQGFPRTERLPGAVEDRRTCPMCRRPVMWRPNKRQWSMFCGSQSCSSPVRYCRKCGEEYLAKNGNQAYCSVRCRDLYHHDREPAAAAMCPICAQLHKGKNRWQLCSEHWAVIMPVRHALVAHKVPTSLVVGLIKHPFCPIDGCGQPLLEHDRSRGRLNLVVDHDHNLGCHPGPVGCELCVRGLICWVCNTALHKDATPRLHRGRAAYLEAWECRGEA